MRKICLTLPTNRECSKTISIMAEEAAYAAGYFGVEVHFLILDSTDEDTFAGHAKAVDAARGVPNVVIWHLDEAAQRDFLRDVIRGSGVSEPELMLDLMLPTESSYGACTNRAFLLASALGCDSVHRRDSDSRYQILDGAAVFPIHHEMMSLGKRSAEAAGGVSQTILDPAHADQPVVMVGSSFVGELSVDIGEIAELNPDAYYDVVSLWAPVSWTAARKRALVDESFTGSKAAFTHDWSTLTIVDPMTVDMHNIAFCQVQEQVPLLPATNTIGSDYFLIHVVYDAKLPGVEHNRNIVNFHTPERKTESGFPAYQLRFVKFFLSMHYLNFIYERMAEAGPALLDDRNHIRGPMIIEFVRESMKLDQEENIERLDVIDRAYRKLGGKYAAFADILRPRRQQLLDEAQHDMEYFALLIESWERLIHSSKNVNVVQPQG
ncbi:MAG TPA: DUF6271 family protein [Trebonia sp.]|nr:DUF6271 family protein [Trebonia sp.]